MIGGSDKVDLTTAIIAVVIVTSTLGIIKLYRDAMKQYEQQHGHTNKKKRGGKSDGNDPFAGSSWDDVPLSKWNGGGGRSSSSSNQKAKDEDSDEDDEMYQTKTFGKQDSSWERSKKLGEAGLGYYYAHHNTTKDGISSEEYEMEKPKLLKRTTVETANCGDGNSGGVINVNRKKVYLPQYRISSYAWEDKKEDVKLTFRYTGLPKGWDWTQIAPADVQANCEGRKVLLEIRRKVISGCGEEEGQEQLWWFEMSNLYQDIDGATPRVLKTRLALTLRKKNKSPWPKLLK